MKYSPHDLLPVARPLSETPDENFFYENVVKHLIPDILRIMNNGIPIDLQRVKELKEVVDNVIENNRLKLKDNHLIAEYLNKKREQLISDKLGEQQEKFKTFADFIKPFDIKKTEHRTQLVNYLLEKEGLAEYTLPKWTKKDLKTLGGIVRSNFVADIMNDDTSRLGADIDEVMMKIAEKKAELYNEARLKPVSAYRESLQDLEFNLNSPVQKNELFELYDIDTLNHTPTGARKIDRDELNRLTIETEILMNNEFIEDKSDILALQEVLTIMIDSSNSNIISNNFIPAFETYTIENILFGNFQLFGTKTFRLTSNNPNLLNLPSSGNKFSKSVKECLIAPEGWILYAADLSALEDRVVANLSLDENKCNTFLKNLDSHCLNSMYYVPHKIEACLPKLDNETNDEYCTRYKDACSEIKELKQIRQDHKPVTFGLSYGCGPKKIATVLGISLDEATEIYDNYHYKLYPGITNFREFEVLPMARNEGRIHLGLGCYMYSSDPEKECRTLFNACSQFWSILTLLAINKIHHMIDEAGLQDDIKVICTIYDSIYFITKEDPELIQWLNDRIIPLMTKDFLVDQLVHNEAEGEIGYNWYNLKGVKNNASLVEIKEVMEGLNG